MSDDELRQVMAVIAEYDHRQVGSMTLTAWREIIGDLRYDDAQRAVVDHFRTSSDYLMPVHIVAAAGRYEEERQRELRKMQEVGGVSDDVVNKPPFFEAMEQAALAATESALRHGHGLGDDVTIRSAREAARMVSDAWEAEHGLWRNRQWDWDWGTQTQEVPF